MLQCLEIKLKTKTAYQTQSLTSKAFQQQQDAVAVPPSRGSNTSRQIRGPATPSDHSLHTERSDHLPPIHQNNTGASRHRKNNDDYQMRQNFLFPNNRSSPTSPKRYITKSMNTTTTIKKPISGGPVIPKNGPSSKADRTNSNNSKRVRKFWWSPKRNMVEIRTEDPRFKHVKPKVGSFDNIEYRSSGGNVLIRSEPVHWQVSSKIDSLSNANWSPPTPQFSVRTEKLKWDVQAKVGSLDYIDHQPQGGNVAIRDEKLDLSHVEPKVDCGFID